MDWAQRLIAEYGYLAVFAWTFIEGETVFLAAAALAAAGLLSPWGVIGTAALGAFAGHIFFFAIGRRYGATLIERFAFLSRHRRRVERVFHDHAHWSVFVFQYLYGTRIVAAILFGTTTIPFTRFCLLQVLNCLSWAVIVYGVGHLLGIAGMAILERFGQAGLAIIIVSVLLLGLATTLGVRRSRRRARRD